MKLANFCRQKKEERKEAGNRLVASSVSSGDTASCSIDSLVGIISSPCAIISSFSALFISAGKRFVGVGGSRTIFGKSGDENEKSSKKSQD